MSGFIRTADKVANTFRRSAIAVGTSVQTLGATGDPRLVAHGSTGSEQCVLTLGLDGSYVAAASVAITCQYYSTTAKQWFYAGTGASGGGQAVTLYPGGVTTFALPEQTYYFLSAATAIGANLIWTDGMDVPGVVNTQTGTIA
jgi:hypothetical protein